MEPIVCVIGSAVRLRPGLMTEPGKLASVGTGFDGGRHGPKGGGMLGSSPAPGPVSQLRLSESFGAVLCFDITLSSWHRGFSKFVPHSPGVFCVGNFVSSRSMTSAVAEFDHQDDGLP